MGIYKVNALNQKSVELAIDFHNLSLLSLILSFNHLDLQLILKFKQAYSVSTNNIPGTNGIGIIDLSLEFNIHPVLDDRMNHSLGILHDNFCESQKAWKEVVDANLFSFEWCIIL